MGIVMINEEPMFFVSGGLEKKINREIEEEWSLFLLFSNSVMVKPFELSSASFSCTFLITI